MENPEDIEKDKIQRISFIFCPCLFCMLYPAFELVETVQALFSSPEEIPESYHFLWMTVGRRYFADVWDMDVYDVIGAYDKDVLLIHGDSDTIVPLSSSERAMEVYPSAELKILPGAGHGFHGQDAETAAEYMLEYLQRHCSSGIETPGTY